MNAIRKFMSATVMSATVMAGLWMTLDSAHAESTTKLYKNVPSASQLSQDLFGHQQTPSLRTRGIGTNIASPQPKTRGIRWHEEQVETEAPPAAVQPLPEIAAEPSLPTEPTQTASLDPTPPSGEKLAFNIQFHFDSTQIKAESTPFIDRLGEVLNSPDNQGSPLMIVGHTDATGSEDYNWQLSMRRAAAIRNYLVQVWNVDPQTLQIDARGEYEPLAGFDPNDPTNRRVEFWALNG